jgi:opacity protein-like surface antigen
MTRACAVLLAWLAPVSLLAQAALPDSPRSGETLAGFSGIGGAPTGYFGQVVGSAWGLGGSFGWRPGHGPLGLRGEASFLCYASESWSVYLPGASGRIMGELTTSNWIGRLAIGPQITVGRGVVRPYAYATAGTSYFATTTSFSDDSCGDCGASDTNYSDWTFSWSAGGGLLLRVGGTGHVDVGARYIGNGTVNWLGEGDLVQDADDVARPRPRRSPADVVEFTVGFTFNF